MRERDHKRQWLLLPPAGGGGGEIVMKERMYVYLIVQRMSSPLPRELPYDCSAEEYQCFCQTLKEAKNFLLNGFTSQKYYTNISLLSQVQQIHKVFLGYAFKS